MLLFPHRSTLCWKPRHRLRLELQLERSFPACLLAKKSKESNSKLMPRGRMVFYLMVAMQFLYNLVPDLPKFWLGRDARLFVLWMLFALSLWTENGFEVLLILRQASWDSDWSTWTRDLFFVYNLFFISIIVSKKDPACDQASFKGGVGCPRKICSRPRHVRHNL